MAITWEKPPEIAQIIGSGTHRGKYKELAIALKGNPGEWARLTDPDSGPRTAGGANGTAQNIRRGKVKGFELKPGEGKFETAVHETNVWVRFVGPEDDDGDDDEEHDAHAEAHGEDDPEDTARIDELVSRGHLTKKVRAWAKQNGHDVPERGRLPDSVWLAWSRVHFNDGTPKPRAVQ